MSPARSRAFSFRRPLLVAGALLLSLTGPLGAQGATTARVVTDASGSRLQVNGRDFFVRGVNWDYFPIGTNYSYSLWTQPSELIAAALDREMGMLRTMGVNAIRVYNGIPARWIQYIHDRYGIYTVVNHALGRYGNSANGAFVAQTDYSDPKTRAVLTAEVLAIVDELKGTPGLLMYLLGNENNYGLEWRSASTENLPVGERQAAKARFLYSLVGEVARAIKTRDPALPVALANGDIQYLDIIAQEAKGLDVFGTNVYRGLSFGTLFQEVKDKLGIPVMFTEFGADAWNEKEAREDQRSQARYVLSQWREIYEQTSGKGRVGNAIGGMTFQWTDGWWKYGQETRLDIHDANASWANEAYQDDFVRGENNMNEEWWGLAAKGPPDARGLYELYPRAAFYGLQKAYALDPYATDTDLARIASVFGAIDLSSIMMQARADQAAASGGSERLRVSNMRLELSTFNTGGTRLTTPKVTSPASNSRPSARGFDRLESFFVGVEARPNERFQANLTVNILGNVPDNPIDEIFYENRGRARSVTGPAGTFGVADLERLKIFQTSVSWDERLFRLEGFNRTGHYHWGYEGDFFGIYREANYGRNIDIYNAAAPLGMEFTGKRQLNGLKVALGPELWWGANPAAIVKYGRKLGDFTVTGLFHEEVAPYGQTTSSFAIPLPQTRRATLHAATSRLFAGGTLGLEAGGIWGGATRVGQKFQVAEGSPGNYRVLLDEVKASDAFGGKAKVTFQRGRWNWYAQGASMGIVADGGPTSVQTFTGWGLKDTGLNNQVNALT
ncbi:MAG: glycosidase, partial [Gemmatimonadetes bacterium]|nr:glycosidase [Gemmatimonadota bacterium]